MKLSQWKYFAVIVSRLTLIPVGVWIALGLVFSATACAQSAGTPELPRTFLDTSYSPPAGRVISVPIGGDFQAALDAAQPGDIIDLAAGATFSGNFLLPRKTGTDWIYIRSSALVDLPPAGTRVTPLHAPLMPNIVTPNTSPAITTASGAHHYRFVGIEITTTHATTSFTQFGLISLEAAGGQLSLSQVPSSIVFDRCYIHGTPTGNVRRGIVLNSARTAVIDSYLSDFHEVGADSQAILGWNGPGPFKIVNNYLEAAGENLMFGGSDPAITDLVPSDIEVRHNHFFKPLSWRIGDSSYAGISWSVKNLFELKNAQRVLVEGNIFEHNWPHAQNGFSILFTVRNQDGTAPWSVVQDVTFTRNILRHAASGINILGQDNNNPSQQTKRILIKDNLFHDLGGTWGGGTLLQVLAGTADVTFEHNTAFQTDKIIMADGASNSGFVYRNNITPHNEYGVIGTGTGIGLNTLNVYFPGYVFVRNIVAGGNPSSYPADNYFDALSDVGFVDLAGGDFRLAATSPYKNLGTDGKDLGADLEAVETATAGTLLGVLASVLPSLPPADTTPPSISITSPTAGATVSGTVAVSSSYSDDVGVVGVQYLLDGNNLGTEVTSEPFSISWDTTQAVDGTHVLTARARDAAGNQTVSDGVSVTVSNADTAAPVISAVAASDILSSTATLSWTTNEPADSQVEYGTTTAYGQTSALGGSLVTSHSVGLSGLSSGVLYHYRVKSRDAAGNLAVSADQTFTTASDSSPSPTQSPYHGTAFQVPGLIEAEDFDHGGEDIAYHDQVAGNAGGLYRLDESVDIIAAGTGYVVNNFETGEWLEYTINVAQAGLYRIEALVSSEFTTSRWRAEIDGANVTGSISVPSTGSWRTFEWIGKSGISLTAGTHVLRLHAEQEYFNLDAVRIASDNNVVWTNIVNTAATGDTLEKTAGCDGCQDAGATSQQQIVSGDGYVELTASETATQRVIGLSHGSADTSTAEIDFGIQFWPGGGLDVRENGVYRTETFYATGDVFRIAVEGGVVKYSKNGTVFYTSTKAPAYPLLVDTSFLTFGGTVTRAMININP